MRIISKSHYKGFEISKDINIFGLETTFHLSVGVRPEIEENKRDNLAFFDFDFLFRVDKEGIGSEENLCYSDPIEDLDGKTGCFTWLNPKMNYFLINVEYGCLIEGASLSVSSGNRDLITL